MWSYYRFLQKSIGPSAHRGCQRRPVLHLASCAHEASHKLRFFTTDEKKNSKPKKSEKRNFDRDVLQPASRGKLARKHDSGIPKLAGRHKARLGPPPKRSGGRFTKIPKSDQDLIEDNMSWLDDSISDANARKKALEASTETFVFDPDGLASGTSSGPSPSDGHMYSYYAPQLLDHDRYFWSEEDFESLGDFDEELLELEEDGTFEIEIDDSDVATQLIAGTNAVGALQGGGRAIDDDDDEDGLDDEDEEDMRFAKRRRPTQFDEAVPETTNLEEHFFFGQNDIFELAAADEKLFDVKEEGVPKIAMPLRPHGPNLDDFLEAMIEHPTEYALLVSEQLHPDSKREPKPFIPKSRLNPPLDFVESHARFLYVAGLPPLEVDGEEGDLNNPVHCNMLQNNIARLFGIDSDRVFPSSTTSGFVGFSSPRQLADAIGKGPEEPMLYSPARIAIYNGERDGKHASFAKVSPETTMEIIGIPPGNTSVSLADKLFPAGTEVGAAYGVSPDKIHFISPTRALIRFDSEEQAESAIVSQTFGEQLKNVGEYPVRLFRARRELVHAGFDGPYKMKEKRTMGPRLVVDGDMPSKKFYLSHARVISLRNLDPGVSKEEIAAAFQPYCARPRDVHGSVEFVTCEKGLPTGRAYVGFDVPLEAEAVISSLKGSMRLGNVVAKMRPVKDRRIPGIPIARPEKRPERAAEELLDDLNNWERYVEPEDLKLLVAAGISKDVLGEALRGIRYNNASFGVFDASIRAEALQPEKETGELYRELVQMYVSTLKDCIATPEDVGELYESVHFPGEQLDLSIFEQEKIRQHSLHERRVT